MRRVSPWARSCRAPKAQPVTTRTAMIAIVPLPSRYEDSTIRSGSVGMIRKMSVEKRQGAIGHAAHVGGRHADEDRDERRERADDHRDDQRQARSPDQLREHVLADLRRPQQVVGGRSELLPVDRRLGIVGRDQAGEERDEDDDDQEAQPDRRLPVAEDRAPEARARVAVAARRDGRRRGDRAAHGDGHRSTLTRRASAGPARRSRSRRPGRRRARRGCRTRKSASWSGRSWFVVPVKNR